MPSAISILGPPQLYDTILGPTIQPAMRNCCAHKDVITVYIACMTDLGGKYKHEEHVDPSGVLQEKDFRDRAVMPFK